jgi:hypothetical protein
MNIHADHAEHGREWRPSPNLPPFTVQDLAGILVAILGTLALILIATTSAAADPAPFGVVTIIRMLLAGAATLINLAHIVGIVFFESVDYHGTFERFFARMSLVGTPIAILVSLALGLFA